MKIPALIVNYNGGQLLRETLRSLEIVGDLERLQIYIYDNASQDDSLALAEAAFPALQITRGQKNLGFAAANNQLLQQVKADYAEKLPAQVLLLNPDLSFAPGWLDALLAAAESHPQTAAFNPLLIYQDKFVPVAAQAWGEDLYLHSEDYRTTTRFQTSERLLGSDSFHKLPQAFFEGQQELLLAATSMEAAQELGVFNASLQPFQLQVAGSTFTSGWTLTFRQLLWKLGLRKDRLKKWRFHLPSQTSTGASVELLNSFGADFRPGADLPDNHFTGATVAEAEQQLLAQTGFGKDYCEVKLFHGACALLDWSALQQVGGFSEDYFLYYEESDLALRLREQGFEIGAVWNSRVYHKERGARSSQALAFMLQSQALFRQRWAGKSR